MHIAFEGPIASGKTTFALRLSKRLGQRAKLVLEDFQGNTFLEDFYQYRERWALPMQIEFLLSRYEQFRAIQLDGITISDHSSARDGIFAEMLLAGRELALYERISSVLLANINPPDLVVLLDAPTDELIERIYRRGRSMERRIAPEYLDELRARYAAYFSDKPYPVLKVDTSAIKLADPDALSQLWDEIERVAGLCVLA